MTEGYRRILVPLDGSKLSHAALEGALPIATSIDAAITLVVVVDPMLCQSFEALAGAENVSVAEAVASYVDGVGRDLAEEGFEVDTAVVLSSGFTVAERIVELAEHHDIDLIAMSTHGRSGLEKAIFGSVATAVLRDSPVPVLVFPRG